MNLIDLIWVIQKFKRDRFPQFKGFLRYLKKSLGRQSFVEIGAIDLLSRKVELVTFPIPDGIRRISDLLFDF